MEKRPVDRAVKFLPKFMSEPIDKAPAAQAPQGTIILPATVAASENPGDKIGRYKLLQEIGEGGMGTVWMAEQEEPVRRRVALKVIKLGMDTKQVIGRFEAERQALALMDHPNIAKVLDAGATENGRPFFVMELVKGIPITKYCDDNKLGTVERLKLFMEVCHAIQHAHQKGIIHRDIKPSNILIANHDGTPVPKVIDFGIAKATGQKLTDKTVFTAFEQFIGTPAYMSPEQAEMNALDVDTRSDIYALGVLFYELLTGKTPLDAKELLSAGLEGMRRMIREKEPSRPSTRISSLENAERTSVASQRGSEPPKLIHLLRGDLDWIAMKCLEKDRTRRYETANGLALDIGRHLNHEPVLARPPSGLYRVSKLIRRNLFVFAAAGLLLAVIIMGLSAAAWMFRNQRNSLQRALQAEQARSQMQHNLGLRELRGASLDRYGGKNYEVLSAAETETRALVEALRKGGQTQSEEYFLRLKELSDLVRGQGKLVEAEMLLREALEVGKKTIGASDRRMLASFLMFGVLLRSQGRFEESEAVFREEVQAARATPNTKNISTALASLTLTLLYDQKFVEAEPCGRELLALNEQDYPGQWYPYNSRSMLGECLLRQKKYAEAEPLLLSGYEGMKQRVKTIPITFQWIRLKEGLERLISFYEETGQPAKAARWRKELEALNTADAADKIPAATSK